jgi:cilia- and flagella-associated protein 57
MKVTHMALSPKEDTIVFTMSSNQIFKVPINLDRPGDDHTYEYLICAFHSHPIFGMDVCLKKQIIATCSSDRTVRVWNYGTHAHEIKPDIIAQFEEEAYSVAVHPSGFSMVVGFSDSIRMLNILQEEL